MASRKTIAALPAIPPTDSSLLEHETGGQSAKTSVAELRNVLFPNGVPTLTEVNGRLDDLDSGLSNITNVYGSITTAEQAAAAAEAIRQEVVGERGQVETIASNAAGFRDAAEDQAAAAAAAKTASEVAATKAAADEALAEAHKDAAGVSASSASGSATTATGKAAIATDAASAAATSQSLAAGHASTAATQAGVSTTQAVAATTAASTATTQAGLSAAYSSRTANLVPNGEFETGPQLWNNARLSWSSSNSGMWQYNSALHGDVYGEMIGPSIPFDPTRKYRCVFKFTVLSGTPSIMYAGFLPANASGNGLGAVYFDTCIGAAFPVGTHTVEQIYEGINAALPIPSYTSGGKMVPTTVAMLPYSLVNYSNNPNTRVDVLSFEVFDVTESTAAASSANIATTQAAVATAAGSTATTQANLSATYASQAAGSASTAGTQATSAAGSAASATASAASALASAVLSASIGKGSLNKNPTFADWAGGSGTIPAGWMNWSNGTLNARRDGDVGGYAFEQTTNSVDNYGISQYPQAMSGKKGAGYYVVTIDATLVSGSLAGAGAYLVQDTVLGLTVGFAAELGTTGVVGRRYKVSKLLFFGTDVAPTWILFAMSNWEGFPPMAAKTIKWHECSVRDATPQEIRDQTVLSPLQATVSTQQTAIATLNTRTATYLNRVTAGAGQAEVELIATDSNGNATSNVNIRAGKITLGGQTAPVLTIADGNATFGSDVYINNAKIIVDTGTYMKVIGKGFGTTNQFVEWYGPKMSFNLCSEANAIQYLKTNGSAYFGGSLSAGILKNSGQNSGLGTNEFFELGPFGTNGGPKLVSVSWSYEVVQNYSYPATSAGLNAFNADASAAGAVDTGEGYFQGLKNETVGNNSVTLERSIAGGAYAAVANGGTTIRTLSFEGQRPNVNDGTIGNSTYKFSSVVSFTYTDNVAGTGDRKFKATNVRSYTMSGAASQRLGIISTE